MKKISGSDFDISGSDFVRSFFQEYRTNGNVRRSYLRPYLSESKTTTSEWTTVMGIFLADLAEKLGFFQEWEVEGRVDFGWYRSDVEGPQVLIEHENDWKTASRELNKLQGVNCRLKVLIAYPSEVRNWFSESEDELDRSAKSKYTPPIVRKCKEMDLKQGSEFVIVCGDSTESGPIKWWIFIFNRDKKPLRTFEMKTNFYKNHFALKMK